MFGAVQFFERCDHGERLAGLGDELTTIVTDEAGRNSSAVGRGKLSAADCTDQPLVGSGWVIRFVCKGHGACRLIHGQGILLGLGPFLVLGWCRRIDEFIARVVTQRNVSYTKVMKEVQCAKAPANLMQAFNVDQTSDAAEAECFPDRSRAVGES